MQRKLGRALLIIWFSNALPCVALRCVACIGQGKRAHSWLGMRATKARLIPRRLRLIIPDRLYAHAPVSLARGFFSTLLFASRTAASESAVRATFFTCHHRSTNPTTFLVHRSRSPRFYLNNWWQFRGNTSPRSSVFRSHGELGGRERGVTVK